MVFSSFEFLVFFLVVVLLLLVLQRIAGRWPRFSKWVLLAASYGFYVFWDYRFTALLIVFTAVGFVTGVAMHRARSRARRKWLLWASVTISLGLLGVFKYCNFFVDSVSFVLRRWGLGASNLDIILPVGISFYTFQVIGYVVDVFQGKIEPERNILDFALFVAFFPKLVAGPIVRAGDFVPQLKKPVRITGANVWAGSQLFIVGLFKKLMIADAVAPFVSAVYAYPEYYSSPTVWLAVGAYALQIYCDFSGYSDMAIGCARILGFHFDRNFHMPYLSRNVQQFWRRWHISLSNWLRDYLYIPLGGNRKGSLRTYANAMITMTLGGLWHGASWNFVIWGAAHGLALVAHRWWSSRLRHRKGPTSRATRVMCQTLGTAATLLFVAVAWVLFRAPDTQTALTVFGKLLFIGPGGARWYYHAALAAFGWTALGHIVGSLRESNELVFFETPFSYRAAFAVSMALLIIYVFAPTHVSPFIYFSF
jgi:alginate O-acetyltransferase complex protein AlgI